MFLPLLAYPRRLSLPAFRTHAAHVPVEDVAASDAQAVASAIPTPKNTTDEGEDTRRLEQRPNDHLVGHNPVPIPGLRIHEACCIASEDSGRRNGGCTAPDAHEQPLRDVRRPSRRAGCVVDYHTLRETCLSWLGQIGEGGIRTRGTGLSRTTV